MSRDLKDLIDTVEVKESTASELEQEVKLLREDIKRLNFTVSEQRLLIKEQERKIASSEVYELPGDIQILKDMLISQRQEIKKKDKDVEILDERIYELTNKLKKSKVGGESTAESEELIKAKKLVVQLTEENELYRVNENNAKELIENLTKEKESYREEMETLIAETLNRELDISDEISNKSESIENIKSINGAESLKLEVENLKNKVIQLKQKLKVTDSKSEKPITQEKELNRISYYNSFLRIKEELLQNNLIKIHRSQKKKYISLTTLGIEVYNRIIQLYDNVNEN